tara:strand:- start:176 stop:637 length:462 start_codon:yes stop_codon:yes gene_type:complete
MKNRFIIALIAFVLSTFTIGLISFISLNTNYNLLIGSFGATMVLIFGFPESPFSQPKNIFFGHLITSLIGILIYKYLFLEAHFLISLAVGLGIFSMILFNVTHPPAGGNAIIIILLENTSYNFLLFPVSVGAILIIFFGVLFNRFLLKKRYPQ